MLEAILRYLNNWFVVPGGVHVDTYTVEDGSIALPFLQSGQYFRVIGSVFNDGVYEYSPGDLIDETFHGAVWALAIPAEFMALVGEIEAWQTKYGEATSSPYTSESYFGAYSYTKATSATTGSTVTWKDVFTEQLNAWRKI